MKRFLFQPVKPFYINQGFGENKSCIDLATNKVFSKVPYADTATCPEGSKSVYSQMLGHNGLDLMAARWQTCYAAQDGIVDEVETEESRGLGVGIVTNEKYPCPETGQDEYFKVRYWHFIALNVHTGDKIKVGDLIGWCDSTGYSSGDHLHFELKPVRKNIHGDWDNVLQSNGYFGAVNPVPYIENVFALDFAGVWRKAKEIAALIADILTDRLRK